MGNKVNITAEELSVASRFEQSTFGKRRGRAPYCERTLHIAPTLETRCPGDISPGHWNTVDLRRQCSNLSPELSRLFARNID